MRTSRVSQDTARILAATRTQRTLRQTRSRANIGAQSPGSGAAKSGVKSEDEDNDSDLSSYAGESSSDGDSRPMKRQKKRGVQPVAVKLEKEEVSITAIQSPQKPKRARRVPAKKITAADGTVKIEPPPNWEEIYALTREMRNENIAPVDTMGCESLAERHRSPRDRRFQTLIALMLSSQTKDTVTAVAMRGMQENMAGV